MTNGLLRYGEIFAHFLIYWEAHPHIWLCNCSTLNFLIYEENLIFFFISAYFPYLAIFFFVASVFEGQVSFIFWQEALLCSHSRVGVGGGGGGVGGKKSKLLKLKTAGWADLPWNISSTLQLSNTAIAFSTKLNQVFRSKTQFYSSWFTLLWGWACKLILLNWDNPFFRRDNTEYLLHSVACQLKRHIQYKRITGKEGEMDSVELLWKDSTHLH